MSGSPCPKCGHQVMNFREFFLHAEPHKTYRCAACDAELTRSSAVWVVIIVAGVAGVAVGIIGSVAGLQRLGAWMVLAMGVLAIGALTLVVKVVAYKLPLWRIKAGA